MCTSYDFPAVSTFCTGIYIPCLYSVFLVTYSVVRTLLITPRLLCTQLDTYIRTLESRFLVVQLLCCIYVLGRVGFVDGGTRRTGETRTNRNAFAGKSRPIMTVITHLCPAKTLVLFRDEQLPAVVVVPRVIPGRIFFFRPIPPYDCDGSFADSLPDSRDVCTESRIRSKRSFSLYVRFEFRSRTLNFCFVNIHRVVR